jgi:uncharacterized Zn finger protein
MSRMEALAKLLTRGTLLELAGETYFERGEEYRLRGLVRSLDERGEGITARVLGTYEYRVKLRAGDDELRYSCTCPLGVDGIFCKHCVAAGLAWIEGRKGRQGGTGEPAFAMGDVRAYLERRDRDALVRIILERAEDDDLLRERLLMLAAGENPEGPDLATFRRIIEEVFDPGGPPDPYSDWEDMQRVENVVESIAGLLEKGFAEEAIELAEHALGVAERAMDYYPDGYMSGVMRDLEELHHAACERAKPEPVALARRLFEWELRGHYDVFFEAAETYADVLGERGLAEYRRLAEEEWARISRIGPGQRDPEGYGRRSRITRIMQTLARRSGDVEELVAVKSRDLSHSHAYMEIAEVYRLAGRHDEALEWAERGVRDFPDPDPRLREFLAAEYRRRNRPEDAMEVIWEEFAARPHLDNYRKLKAYTDRLEDWTAWRKKALEHLRERIAEMKEKQGRWYRVDHSILVRIFLWEGRYEEAWQEAREGGCSPDLWLQLAARREKDHPEDAISVYRSRIEAAIEQKNKKAYREARDLLIKVRELMRRLDREPEFAAYLDSIRAAHRRKRNLMALLERLE